MTHTTYADRLDKRERALRPVFAAVAVFATLATLGLGVIAPAVSSPASTTVEVAIVRVQPTEVAIAPASIHVIATRAKVARNTSHFVPAVYRTRQ
jgi:hypothetical protein